MTITTGLSGNEMDCLAQKGVGPRNIVVGNSVYSLGFVGSITSSLKSFVRGQITALTKLIYWFNYFYNY